MSRDRRCELPQGAGRGEARANASIGKTTLTQALPVPDPGHLGGGGIAAAARVTVQRKAVRHATDPSASPPTQQAGDDIASLFRVPPTTGGAPVRRLATSPIPASDGPSAPGIAARGVVGAGASMPHFPLIQASFGHHDVSSVQSYQGPAATNAARELGAEAYAIGNAVAFSRSPDLHTAAHEAAHVVQQRAGVQLKGGIDQPGDAYERHADAVADRVVAQRSVEDLLDHSTTSTLGVREARPSVQRKESKDDAQILANQASLKGPDVEIPALEGALLATRKEAVQLGLLSQASFDAGLALSQAMTQLQPSVAAKGTVDRDIQERAAVAAQQLFSALQSEAAGDKNFQI